MSATGQNKTEDQAACVYTGYMRLWHISKQNEIENLISKGS